MTRFLVVQEDPASLTGLTLLLRRDGFDVSPFVTGLDAVAALAREAFDVVVTDLKMPQIDGRAVMRAARQNQPDACLIVGTAHAEGGYPELREAGACFIAEEPIDHGAVVKAIAECRARGCCRAGSREAQASLGVSTGLGPP